ncbi:MAG: hypothetical protein PHI97_23650 [Desulfobulbus sp.]|nr:hypothetical protein [Desulfobulbus sp.]
MIAAIPNVTCAKEEYSLNIEEFEKKAWEMGGYAELKWEHMDVRQGSAFSVLNFYDDPQPMLDQLTGSLLLNGSYAQGISRFNWLLKAYGQEDTFGWTDTADAYEAYLNISSSSGLTATVGKRSYKWGKGYAWNPTGFINRVKDPNNPEEALEGYMATDVEVIRSYSGDLRNLALTTALLPVWQGVNEDFGTENNVNLATKLYLLYLDTDIDLILFSGNSRTTRFGADFSRNVTSNFEVHGEVAYIPEMERLNIDEEGRRFRQSLSATSYLVGIRYLTEFDLTSIVEYYQNGGGYSEEEMSRFYQLVSDSEELWAGSGKNQVFQPARQIGAQEYSRPNPGQDYLYLRFSQKEPFDILYFTPALTTIINLDDQSYSITPEIAYTGITNWEVQLRFFLLNGGQASEFGEKQNANKLELRIRYFF